MRSAIPVSRLLTLFLKILLGISHTVGFFRLHLQEHVKQKEKTRQIFDRYPEELVSAICCSLRRACGLGINERSSDSSCFGATDRSVPDNISVSLPEGCVVCT